MAFDKGIVTVTLDVEPAPGCFLTATPLAVVVDQGDVATYLLTATPTNGYAGPIYLRAVNLSHCDVQPEDPSEDSHHFTPNPIPAGGGTSVLTIETDGWDVTLPPLEIGIEAVDVLPFDEYPVT